MSNLPTLLFIALAVACCSGYLVKESKDLMKKRHCTWLGCHPRWARSLAEEQPDTKVIYSDLPTDRILQEVKSHYMTINEDAEIIQDENQVLDNNRHKRGVRAVIIKICNRRTRHCRIIVVYRRY